MEARTWILFILLFEAGRCRYSVGANWPRTQGWYGKLARLTETASGAVHTVSPALAHPDTNQVLSKVASSSGRNAARAGLLTEKNV